jgi:hypothetical protein
MTVKKSLATKRIDPGSRQALMGLNDFVGVNSCLETYEVKRPGVSRGHSVNLC